MQHSANQFRHSAKSLPWPCFRKRYWILSTENRWSINLKMSLLHIQEKSKWKVTFMAHAGLVVKFYAIVVREFHVRGGLLSGNQMSMSIKIWGWWRLLNNCFKSGPCYELFPLILKLFYIHWELMMMIHSLIFACMSCVWEVNVYEWRGGSIYAIWRERHTNLVLQ